MMVGFCWRYNWTVGSSIDVLTDLTLFRYQTAIKYTQFILIINILGTFNKTSF